MAKVSRGTKRLCEACGGKFYDLDRSPIVCPMCDTELVLEQPKAKPEPKTETEPSAEPEKKPETAAAAEAEAPEAPAAEFISLDEAAAEEEQDDDAALADIDGDDEDIPAAGEDEDVFLEDDEDEAGSDVSGIIGGPIDTKKEES